MDNNEEKSITKTCYFYNKKDFTLRHKSWTINSRNYKYLSQFLLEVSLKLGSTDGPTQIKRLYDVMRKTFINNMEELIDDSSGHFVCSTTMYVENSRAILKKYELLQQIHPTHPHLESIPSWVFKSIKMNQCDAHLKLYFNIDQFHSMQQLIIHLRKFYILGNCTCIYSINMNKISNIEMVKISAEKIFFVGENKVQVKSIDKYTPKVTDLTLSYNANLQQIKSNGASARNNYNDKIISNVKFKTISEATRLISTSNYNSKCQEKLLVPSKLSLETKTYIEWGRKSVSRKNTTSSSSSDVKTNMKTHLLSIEKIISRKIDIKINEIIGYGQFSTVYCVTYKSMKYALKHYKQTSTIYNDNEIKIQLKLFHPNIVEIKKIVRDNENAPIGFLMEYCEDDLFSLISRQGPLNEEISIRILKQIIKGIDYIHQCKIVHRDLKTENIMISHSENSVSKFCVKIGDFGLATEIKIQDSNNIENIDNIDNSLSYICGTPSYAAPEMLKRLGYGRPIDIWGLGIIFFITLSGYPPFNMPIKNTHDELESIFKSIVNGDIRFESKNWCSISPDTITLTKQLLAADPKDRPTAAELVSICISRRFFYTSIFYN